MSKLSVFNFISLDGYYKDLNNVLLSYEAI